MVGRLGQCPGMTPAPTWNPSASDGMEEVSTWFKERGFDVAVTEADGVWWATLTSTNNPTAVIARYGRGDSPEAAAVRARERYEQEQ